jgi:hypothetical protein
MSKNARHSSNDKQKSDAPRNSLPKIEIKGTNENNCDMINTYESFFKDNLEKLEREADIQSRQIELNDCIEFVSQFVDLLKHTVIIPELQFEDDWHDDIGHQIKRNKGTTGNRLLDDKVERIAISKGLTKEQWKALLYLNLTAGDSLEMITVTRNHLKKVHDMASRLLEHEEQLAVFALIDAIKKYMPESHFIDK